MGTLLRTVVPLAAGLGFGLGLIASGMTDPAKVLAFLDVTGAWDPSLALVMGAAIGVALLPFAWMRRRSRSLLGLRLEWPQPQQVDGRLLMGGVLFGAGWGLSGLCPGPAVVAMASGLDRAWIFVLAMLVGLLAVDLLDARHPGATP